MYYLGSRFYDTEICRFINADSIDILDVQDDLEDLNLYAYCNNNPVNYEDPEGTVAVSLGFVSLTVIVVTYVYVAGVRKQVKEKKSLLNSPAV